MLSRDPTYLGTVASVSGSAISVHLAESVASGLSIIEGRTYKIGQVGSFVRIPQGYQDLFGVVSEVGAKAAPEKAQEIDTDTGRWMQIQLVGESIGGAFERGISQYPNIGDRFISQPKVTLHEFMEQVNLGRSLLDRYQAQRASPRKLAWMN